MDYEPIAVALKFGFLAVLYLFLFWVARSALKDLRVSGGQDVGLRTGVHAVAPEPAAPAVEGWLVVEGGPGLTKGERYDLFGGITLGRSPEADVRLEDPYASQIHARVYAEGDTHYVEDMNSTNGTLVNSEQLNGEAPLRPNDRIVIGDTELRYQV